MAGASLTVISCTKTTAPGTEASPEGAITFSGVDTRAAVEDASEIGKFSVWGYYTPEDASSTVFDEVTVTRKDSQWKYDGLKFWQSDKQYDFYALYPPVETLRAGGAADNITCNASGALSITGFDSTKGHDLMTASRTNMSGNTPQTVSFTFSHELAKINVMGKVIGGAAEITSITFSSNLHTKGDYIGKIWSFQEYFDNPVISSSEKKELNAAGVNIFTDDLLIIPQKTENITITIVYNTDTEISKTRSLSVYFPEVPEWEAGKSYRYVFTIIGDYIIFNIPTVNTWNDAVGGSVVVDVTK